jgi:hypothetical protein
MSLFGQKGLTWPASRRSRASLVRTSIRGPTRAHISYAFETAIVTDKFPTPCHNPLNVGSTTSGCASHPGNQWFNRDKLNFSRVGGQGNYPQAAGTQPRQALRTQFHTLWYRARQRKSLRVFALGQRLRRFADHITNIAGEANGHRVRQWFQAKKAGWYAVLEDP